MRVLIVTGFKYLPQSKGGAESSTHELVVALRAKGHKVAVLAALMPKHDLVYFWNRSVYRFTGNPSPADNLAGYKVYRAWSTNEALEAVCRDFAPEVVAVQSGEPARLTNLSLEFGYRTVLFLRDVEYSTHGGHYSAHKNLRVVANSQFTANHFKESFGIDSIVIPPAIDPAKYYVPESKRIFDSVLFVNPHPSKGAELAFALAEAHPDIPFLFVESWRLDPEIRDRYLRLAGQRGNIQWLTQQKDMRKVYRRARITIAPSQWQEAWCRVASESHVNGTPVIASDVGGLPESVGPGGVLIDSSKKELWVAELGKLWNDKAAWKTLSTRATTYSRRSSMKLRHLRERLVLAITTI